MGYVNAFLVDGDELTLVDVGLPGLTRTFLKAIRDAGRNPEDLRHIAVTHHHADHTGSLAPLVARIPGATIYAHPLDIPVIIGKQPIPGPNPGSRLGKILGPLIMRMQPTRLEHVDIQHPVQHGAEIPAAGGMTVIHTPGHTAGHVSFLRPGKGGILFVGDAAANMFGRVGLPIGMFSENMTQARESMRTIAELEFEAACFGHGTVITGKAHAAFRRWVEKQAG